MWYELRVILHNRENTLVTRAIQTLIAQERDFVQTVLRNWETLADDIDAMPFE